MNEVAQDIIMHYGMKYRSGRYPWGSGEDPYQHGSRDFLGRVEELKKQGWTETAENIKKEFGPNVTLNDYRNEKSWCTYARRLQQVETAKRLRDKEGLGATEIGRKMGINESTVRSLLNEKSEERMKAAASTADFLKKVCDEKGMIDVGEGVEHELNISRTRLDLALYGLEGEGYRVYGGRMDQPTNPGQKTTQKVLCPPGTDHKEIYNLENIHTINDYISRDGGDTYEKKFNYPSSMDSKRLMIRYKEDGGIDRDGLVELRPGVKDLSLGESIYSQVRILVDGKKYIKGMAVYGDPKDFPPGVDVIFNTNKTKDIAKMDVLKKIKDDPDNPFGSAIKDANQGGQYWYDPKTGKRVNSGTPGAKLGLINKRADEGDWTDWQDTLPAQFLSKQSKELAQKQLNLAKIDKMSEYEDICALTNPTIKKYYLNKFADSCDSAAVNLKAAALPGQKYHVIIPINTLKDNEIYAPRYADGTKLALVRYPHGGTFEIPICTVNNKNPLARKILGTVPSDAVGINKNVADRLSGADFDGDTVMTIPTHDPKGKVKIASTSELEGLKGFDPKIEYPERPGMKYMKDPKTGTDNTQKEMGVISNLITDMTLGGAPEKELAAAVRHSMVVIDAAKHNLDYKRSETENHIDALKKKWQAKEYDENGNVTKYGGASTLISRSSGQATVERRQGSPRINVKGTKYYDPSRPEGALLYKTSDDLYYPDKQYDKTTGIETIRTIDGKKVSYNVKDQAQRDMYAPVKKKDPDTGDVIFTNKAGDITYRTKVRTQRSTNMAEVDDANELVSKARHPMELIYADYANSMKDLANKARLEMVNTGNLEYSNQASKIYANEVKSLKDKLTNAEKNKVRERAAVRMANIEVSNKKKAAEAAGEPLKNKDIKKASQQAMTKYRQEVGSVARRDRNIKITDKEWEAIQAGAIHESTLKRILNNADADGLRERSMPKQSSTLSPVKVNKIKAMSASNATLQQIADALGVSASTVSKYLKGVK